MGAVPPPPCCLCGMRDRDADRDGRRECARRSAGVARRQLGPDWAGVRAPPMMLAAPVAVPAPRRPPSLAFTAGADGGRGIG